ncbi:nuclear transport factor 2 family protein [Prolixibacteraceae bacterium Z1-6]|uniref:Nuclear transport factor 2 family protein n=1 Tax=Draconibacterium aestuarii TaxID=2998507 RepID=A0A9X3F3Z4_9BACT|nr:nuclear transport factor 2 family protein [Prolixibacteraceae bacterium Z1-6]
MRKLNYILIILFCVVIISCTNQNQSNHENLEIVETFQKAFEDHDINAIKSVLADDYVGYGPSLSDSINKDDALLIWEHNLDFMYEKVAMNVEETVGVSNVEAKDGGQWISSWGTLTLKFQQKGDETKIWANQIFLVKDGKIKKTIIFYNEADALRQAGYNYVFKEPVRSNK